MVRPLFVFLGALMSYPNPAQGGAIARFLRGAGYVLSALPYLLTTKGLFRHAVTPILINIALLIGLVVSAVMLTDDVLAWFWTAPDDGWVVLYWLAMVLVGAVLLVLAYGVFMVLSSVIAAPFNDTLSERTEIRELGLQRPDSGGKNLAVETARSIVDALKGVAVFVAIALPLLLLNLLPVIGSVLYAVVGGGMTSFFAAMEFMDSPASRRGYSYTQKVRTITSNLALYLGFGIAVTLMLMLPLVNFVVLPVAVVAGTRLFVHLEAHKRTGAFLALLLAFGIPLTGCGDDKSKTDEDVTVDTTADTQLDGDSCPVDPTYCARAVGIMQIGQSEIRLIPAPPGGESFGGLEISNVGTPETNGVIIVERIDVDSSPFVALDRTFGEVPPFVMEPGQSADIVLRLAPDTLEYDCPTATGDADFCGMLSIYTNDPLNSPTQIPIRVDTSSGVLEITPTTIVFEDSFDDQAESLNLRNVGFGPLEIIDARLASPVQGLFDNGPAVPLTLGPGESTEYEILYEPVVLGGGIGTLRFQTSSPITSEANVLVQVGGVSYPQIDVNPELIDLRGASPGRPVTRTLTVSNLGADITLELQAQFAPTSVLGNFTLTANGADVLSTMQGVQPQRDLEIEITHLPVGPVEDATLTLQSNDPLNPTVDITLRVQ